MTTSYFSPSAASRGSSSSTFATRNFTVSERLFLFAFSVACLTAYSDISSPVTSLAPAIPALRANVPMCVKQSSTLFPLQMRCIASLLYFWSKKKPVFCPFSTSTI